VVLVFYPADLEPGLRDQLGLYNELHAEFIASRPGGTISAGGPGVIPVWGAISTTRSVISAARAREPVRGLS
jgi:hypothetical protein